MQPLPPAGGANVNSANNAVKNYPDATIHAPTEMAEAIVSNNPDAPGAVAATAHVSSATLAVANHQTQYNSQAWWKTALGDVGKVIQGTPVLSTIANWANKGLQEVQDDYKFIHSVYVDHGFAQGLLATLGVVGGGAIGSLAGPEGTAIGADIVASMERDIGGQLLPQYQDSYKKSIDPNYKVSIGRDIANGLSNIPGLSTLKDTDHGVGQFISGVTDIAFDMEADPLNNAGKIAASLKAGKYLDYAKDANGATELDAFGKPIVIATIPLAKNSPAATQFLMSLSQKAMTSDMVLNAYKGSSLIPDVLNPVKRAFDAIGEMTKPIEIQKAFPNSQFSQDMLQKLAKAPNGQEVANIIGKSIYSGEVTEGANTATAIALPSRTLAKSFVTSAVENVLKNAGNTTIANERNLLLPKAMPVLDENGNQVLKTKADGTQYPVMKTQLGGLYTIGPDGWNGWNALAGKIRTFTGYKALTINKTLLEQSGKSFNFSDHNAGTALYNMFYYSMPRDVALEKASEIMAEPSLVRQQELYAAGVKETIKAAGIPDDENIVKRIMSHAQRVTTGGKRSDAIYGHDIDGHATGTIEQKPNAIENVNGEPSYKDPFEAALWSWQRGSNAFINFKELRSAMRETTKYGLMYNRADDFWSHYTDKVFAPLTLFTTGFGLRVAGSEALHQVMRAGLASYLTDKIGYNAAKYNYLKMTPEERAERVALLREKSLTELQEIRDHTAQMLTSEDQASLANDDGKMIKSNEVTQDIAQKEANEDILRAVADQDPEMSKIAKLRGLVKPKGWVSSKIAPYLAEDKMNVLTDWLLHMHGMSIPAGVASDHFAHYSLNQAERVSQMLEQHGHGGNGIEDVTSLTGKDTNYHAYWAQNLSKLRNEKMAQDIAKDYLRLNQNPEFQALSNANKWNQITELHTARVANPKQYADLRDSMVGLRDGQPASFADAQVKSFRGLVEGKDGTIHDQLINNIANGKRTFSTDLKQIAPISSPLKVLGKEPRNTMDSAYQRIIQLGYRTFINPVMDSISREPLYGHYLYENYRNMKPLLDSGNVSKSEALQIAGQKAVINMIPLIHNPALRSQFAMLSRNLLPFYFAQEQAIKRYGRLAYQAPQALREFQIINHGINNPGFVHTDSSGNKYIVYPLIGEFGNMAVRAANALGINQFNLPDSVTGNMTSLGSVLPEAKMPGINPFVTIPLEALTNHFPWANKITNFATGGYTNTSWLDVLFPNSAVRDVYGALSMDDKLTMVHNAILSAMASAYYNGDLPDNYASLPASIQQQYLDRIDNNARSTLFLKGILSFFLPLAPNVSNDYYDKAGQSLRSEFLALQNQTNPLTKKPYTLPEATQKFLAEHGNNAISYTAYQTQTGVGGADLPLNDSTLQWLNKSQSLMSKYQYGAAYLVPQTKAGKDALQVEQDLLTKQLRSKETPQQFMDAMYIAKGWVDVSDAYTQYQKDIQAARASGNRMSAYQITQAWNDTAQNYGLSNPTWYADYINPSRLGLADNALSDFQKMEKNGDLTGPQAFGIKSLLDSYNQYHADLQANTYNVAGIVKHTPMYASIQNIWFNYLTTLEAQQQNLTNVINSVFKRVK